MTHTVPGSVPVLSALPLPTLSPRRAICPVKLYPDAAQERLFRRWDRLERRAERMVEILLRSVMLRPRGTPPLSADELRALARLSPGHAQLPGWLGALDPTLSVLTPIALNRHARQRSGQSAQPPEPNVNAAWVARQVFEALGLDDASARSALPFGLIDGAVRGLMGPLFHRAGQPDEIRLSALNRARRADDPLQLSFTHLRVVDRTTAALVLWGGRTLLLRAELFALPPWWAPVIEQEHRRHRDWETAGRLPVLAPPGQKRAATPHPPITCGVLQQVGDGWQLLLRMSDAVAAVPPPFPAPDLGVLGLDPGKQHFLTGYDGLTPARPKRRSGQERAAGGSTTGQSSPLPAPGEVRFPPLVVRPEDPSLPPLPADAHPVLHEERRFDRQCPSLYAQYRVGARYARIGIEAPSPPGLQDLADYDFPEWTRAQFLPVLQAWWASDVFPGVGRRWVVTTTRACSSTRCPNCRARPVRPAAPGGPTRAVGWLESVSARPEERGLRVRRCGTCGWRGDRDVAGAWNSWLDAHDPGRPHLQATLPAVLLTDLCASQEEGRLAPPDVLRWDASVRLLTRRPLSPCSDPEDNE